jgi:hypothetical protein
LALIRKAFKPHLRSATFFALFLIAALPSPAIQTQPAAKPAPTQAPPAAAGANIGSGSGRINAPEQTYQYPDGQTFIYNVDWRLMNAGTTRVRLDMVNGERHVVASADSTGAVAMLYRVHDRLETFFNPQTNCALSLVKHTEEGFRRVETSVHYDYSRKKAVLDERNVRAKNQKHEEIDIPSCVTNTLAAAYYVASQPLPTGAKLIFPSADGGKPADIQVIVEAREEVKTPSGKYNTVRISAEALNGPQQGKGKVWMWYSDDARRIPVQMRARAFWGTMTFHLTQISSAPPERAGE